MDIVNYNLERQFDEYENLTYFISRDRQLQDLSYYKNAEEFNKTKNGTAINGLLNSCEGKLRMLDSLEAQGLLAQNTGGTYVGSGGFGYTSQIPTVEQGTNVTTKDMWGFCESQETSSVNPDFYGEFIFPRHKRILERFALSCYGCCEAYNPRWKYVKQLPNLRRVSVSPWANWSIVPEYLGKNYIASVKPQPTPLGTYYMNEAVVREDCRRAVEQTKGGICEFIMKDNHTLGNNPHNAIRWVEIMREEIDRVYG